MNPCELELFLYTLPIICVIIGLTIVRIYVEVKHKKEIEEEDKK